MPPTSPAVAVASRRQVSSTGARLLHPSHHLPANGRHSLSVGGGVPHDRSEVALDEPLPFARRMTCSSARMARARAGDAPHGACLQTHLRGGEDDGLAAHDHVRGCRGGDPGVSARRGRATSLKGRWLLLWERSWRGCMYVMRELRMAERMTESPNVQHRCRCALRRLGRGVRGACRLPRPSLTSD